MASGVKFYCFIEDIAEKVHNLGSDTLKLVYSNSDPALSVTNVSGITQISGTNGYTTGGLTVTTSSSAQSSGAYKLILADNTMTASGGAIGPFRYIILINSTAGGAVIEKWDYGSSITLNSGETFTVDFDGTNGALTGS